MADVHARYVSLLKDHDVKYYTLKEVSETLASPFSAPNEMTIFGVIRQISSNWRGVYKSTHKQVALLDPTVERPVEVTVVVPKGMSYYPASMLKLKKVKKKQLDSGGYCLRAEEDWVYEFNFGKYDYEEEDPIDTFLDFRDRNICEVLETWYSDYVTSTKLKDLKSIVDKLKSNPSSPVAYVDLVGQPWRKRLMQQSLVVTFTDGTTPSVKIKDPYNPEYAGFMKNQEGELESGDGERAGWDHINAQKFGHINIWNNEDHVRNAVNHFETAYMHDLSDDWWLLFLNVEVRYKQASETEEECVELILRSGHHRGKGIRTIRKESILGQKMLPHWEKVDNGLSDDGENTN